MSEQAQGGRRRRWPLIVGALVVVVVVVIAGAVGWWFTGGAEYWARSRWQPPKEALLSSMKVHPVPGWTTNVVDLGLPPGSTIATLDAPWLPSLFTNTPPRTYLLVSSPNQTTPQWWLTGVDASNGRPLFPSVKLNASARMPRCFLNGAAVVCISDDRTAATAWVIDGQNGQLTYNGPTNVRLNTGKLEAAQAGSYLVAATKGRRPLRRRSKRRDNVVRPRCWCRRRKSLRRRDVAGRKPRRLGHHVLPPGRPGPQRRVPQRRRHAYVGPLLRRRLRG